MSIKILFSPSEGKNNPQNILKHKDYMPLESKLDSKAVREYVAFLQTASEQEIATLFGSKTLHIEELSLAQNLFNVPCIESIRLYNGVGYKALDFESLPHQAQVYLYQNLYIFSNLFGAVRADERIPYYNLHQGKGKGAFALKNLYKHLKPVIDEVLSGQEVLDLRAEAYMKVYECKCAKHYAQIVFLKDSKKVSHYAKFYRGIYARAVAQNGISHLDELVRLEIENLHLCECSHTQNATILTYEVSS
ncbi:YaaA family protein [Helicobacter sp. MIT 21-1697]|uniref:YaaA family protein n=1 Tax=Helicobacter sp. MIT 21-1697 TaxID=2993733 RepID=UPI00224B5478|nr:YaaA family protein [Helicobacter sp. MIT 21-1697]MCX2716765.1 YaaA family protein [Helicobacter sp. MIT 21-1697]